jgi:carbonic anhydrase
MNPSKLWPLWLALCIAVMLSCNSSSNEKTENPPADSVSTTHESTSVRPVHWSYSEEGGPAGWGKLSLAYAICDSGKSQSPIDLLQNAGKGSDDWKIDYKTTTLEITHNEHVEELINNGHTIQVTTQKGSSIKYGDKLYYLKQFHFHTPSEHTVNGKHSPMEIHLVHESDDKSLAVIGVLVEEGKHNNNFDQLIRYLPNAVGDKKTYDSVKIDVGISVPKELSAWHYIGSLTTPPCTQNVQWLVLKNHITLDKTQIEAFSSRLKNNSRPVQPMNERKLTIDHMVSEN